MKYKISIEMLKANYNLIVHEFYFHFHLILFKAITNYLQTTSIPHDTH